MGSCPDTDIDPTLVWAKHLVTAVSRKVVGKKHKDARENPKDNVGSFQVTDFLDLRILGKSEKTKGR